MNPVDDFDLYDVLTVTGVNSPGIVKLSGHSRKNKWDEKDGDAQGGATITFKGEKLLRFTATFYLTKGHDETGAEIDEFVEWSIFMAVLRPGMDGKTALDIYHPDLAANLATSFVIEGVGGMVHDGMGGATIAIDFVEFRPPKPKSGTPKPKNDPNAAAKSEIEKLLNEAKAP